MIFFIRFGRAYRRPVNAIIIRMNRYNFSFLFFAYFFVFRSRNYNRMASSAICIWLSLRNNFSIIIL